DGENLKNWVATFYPHHVSGDYRHKKTIEFYVTHELLMPNENDVLLDAAGGQFSYLGELDCQRKILQDLVFPEGFEDARVEGVECIECDVREIPLDDGSVDKISCHHSFEHFQENADMHFIEEVQRLLAPDGRCVILPILLGSEYIELTDAFSFGYHSDPCAQYLIDPTAALPGGNGSGNFARIYDLYAFRSRVLDIIDRERFGVSMYEIHIDGQPAPDLTLPIHRVASAINHPYRALLLERK
ncbi:MAG: class I SAM-dependent methyltransferase, partial [Spartobacteria bacterium]|nr:class I SAM-dependent methyltransferase [Spartobacteria bacterium]